MISHHFEDIFDNGNEPENLERARRLAPKVFEFSRFLLEVAGVEDVGQSTARLGHGATADKLCASRNDGVHRNEGWAARAAQGQLHTVLLRP